VEEADCNLTPPLGAQCHLFPRRIRRRMKMALADN